MLLIFMYFSMHIWKIWTIFFIHRHNVFINLISTNLKLTIPGYSFNFPDSHQWARTSLKRRPGSQPITEGHAGNWQEKAEIKVKVNSFLVILAKSDNHSHRFKQDWLRVQLSGKGLVGPKQIMLCRNVYVCVPHRGPLWGMDVGIDFKGMWWHLGGLWI